MLEFDFYVAPENVEAFRSALRDRVHEHAVGPCGLTYSQGANDLYRRDGTTSYIDIWRTLNDGRGFMAVRVFSFPQEYIYIFSEGPVNDCDGAPMPEATMCDMVDAINTALALGGLPVMEMSYVLK
jgi:hypothetical protein